MGGTGGQDDAGDEEDGGEGGRDFGEVFVGFGPVVCGCCGVGGIGVWGEGVVEDG